MIKRIVFLISIAAMLASQSFAQLSVGGNVGLLCNRPFMQQTVHNYFDYYGHVGGELCLTFEYNLKNRWNIAFEASVQQKGYESIATSHYSNSSNRDVYLSLPLTSGFTFAKTKVGEFSLNAGVYMAYWCCSYRKVVYVKSISMHKFSYYDKREIDDSTVRRFEFGLVGGLRYRFNLGARWSICLSASYQYALTDQFKAPPSILFLNPNDAFIVKTGFLYHFN